MKWNVNSSWAYDKKGSAELVMDLVKDEQKYGKVIKLSIGRFKWPIKLWKDKSKWLMIQMAGTAEQHDECMEFLLERMNRN